MGEAPLITPLDLTRCEKKHRFGGIPVVDMASIK
jgi:hypothetical protein